MACQYGVVHHTCVPTRSLQSRGGGDFHMTVLCVQMNIVKIYIFCKSHTYIHNIYQYIYIYIYQCYLGDWFLICERRQLITGHSLRWYMQPSALHAVVVPGSVPTIVSPIPDDYPDVLRRLLFLYDTRYRYSG
jgi:hypothetical protein